MENIKWFPKTTAGLRFIEKESSEIPMNNEKLVPSLGPLCLLYETSVQKNLKKWINKKIRANE